MSSPESSEDILIEFDIEEWKEYFVSNEKRYLLKEMSEDNVVNAWMASQKRCQPWLLAIDDTGIFYLNIPKWYLKYALLNEVLCPNVLAEKWACLEALKQELELLPEKIRGEYIVWRRDFFENLAWLYGDYLQVGYEKWEKGEQSKKNDEIYKQEMEKCFEYLDWIISREGIEYFTKKRVEDDIE